MTFAAWAPNSHECHAAGGGSSSIARLKTNFLLNAAAKIGVTVIVLLVSTLACRSMIWILALLWNVCCLGWSAAAFLSRFMRGHEQRPACRSVALLLMYASPSPALFLCNIFHISTATADLVMNSLQLSDCPQVPSSQNSSKP